MSAPPNDPPNEKHELEPDSRGPATPSDATQAPDPVRRIALGVVVALVVLLFYHVLSDRVTPYSSHGTIETFLVQIAPQVGGPVVEVAATDDQTVERGQLLFRIDPEPYRIAVEAAEAALAEAGQSVGASTAEVAAAQAEVTRRRADLRNVRLQVERVMPLVERDVLAATKGDEARLAAYRGRRALRRNRDQRPSRGGALRRARSTRDGLPRRPRRLAERVPP
jgi:multidrug resistance efflux pump